MVDWEGGYASALEYGITADDMPVGDDELRQRWQRMQDAFVQARQLMAEVDELLRPHAS